MSVIAITGTPATGKTTVAKLVGKKLSCLVIELNEMVHERKLYSGHDKERDTRIVDMAGLKKALGNIESTDMIIESHYAHEMDADLVIVLRANPDEIRERAREKGWSKKKTDENVMAEIMEVCKQEALERGKPIFEVDTTGKTPARVSMEVARIIKKFRKIRQKG